MPEDYISPVIMERVLVSRPIPRETGTEDVDMVEIRDARTNELLAWCMTGDDDSIDRIADILSAKRLPREAMRLREMVRNVRKVGRG
jgi:hypothetical protein